MKALNCVRELITESSNCQKAADLRLLSLVAQAMQRNPESAEVAAAGAEVLIAAAPDDHLMEQAAAMRLLPALEPRLSRWMTRPDTLRPLAAAAAALSAHHGMRAQARHSGLLPVLQSTLAAHPGDDQLGVHVRTAIANIIAAA